VVYDSPLQSVADSPEAYADKPSGLDFIRLVPTAWDETRFLAGEIDEYVVIARRKGRDWYVGAMTDGKQRTLTIPLTFLDKGRYASTIWQDGSDMTSVDTKTGTADRQQSLQLELAPSGGAVAVLRAQ
jgi:alpha-glucosidase